MSEKVFVILPGGVKHMIAVGDFLFVSVDHLGRTYIYRLNIHGDAKQVVEDNNENSRFK